MAEALLALDEVGVSFGALKAVDGISIAVTRASAAP